MTTPIYIGDEVSAAGFRLAGLRIRVPAEGEYQQALEWAMDQGPLVLVSTTVANRISPRLLDSYLSRISPAVVVVPDVHGKTPMLDLSNRLRRQLGVQE
ncbi:MAG: V-type ATP synthase subunit F [Pseudomonadota bacterium]|nr:V-type ATP synthase subunit F [Pseudomonadota bacterium]